LSEHGRGEAKASLLFYAKFGGKMRKNSPHVRYANAPQTFICQEKNRNFYFFYMKKKLDNRSPFVTLLPL